MMFRSAFSLLTTLLITSFIASSPARAYDPEMGTVELHSHLFMDEGLGIMFHGSFNGPLAADSWEDRFSSQVNPETLNNSGIGIMVVSLYALPVAELDLKESIRNQIDTAEAFVRNNPQWVIARTPDEAKQALDNGKRVMVLSLENAFGVLDTEEDLREFVDKRGIRIVTFMHLMDNELGGAAFMQSYHALSNVFSWFFGAFDPTRDGEGTRVNPHGLTIEGKGLLHALIDHHVWIDLSHASDVTRGQMIPIIQSAGQPLLYTHAPLRRYYRSERGITEQQIEDVRRSGGIIGIPPSEEMLVGTEVSSSHCAPGCPTPCNQGVSALAQQYSDVVAIEGTSDYVMFGSDFNGGIPHLSPSCGTHTSLDKEGLWNIGQVPELWKAMRELGAPVPASPRANREAFISAWSKVK